MQDSRLQTGAPVRPRSPEDRLAVERMSFGPGITGPTALALFYLIGGVLTLASAAVPGWAGLDRGSVAAIGAAAALSGGLVVTLRRHLTTASCHVLVALGSLLIGAAMAAGGGGAASATYSSFYVWVAVYAALFFAPRAATTHISWAGACHVVALMLLGDAGVLAQTVVTFGTLGATALVVGALVRQVRTAAATDPLTGLPNRRSFDQHLDLELARADRADRHVALLALDLDGFKKVNDVEGHAAGDELLVEAGRAWTSVLRTGEVLARSGGDEFVVLLPDTGHAGARRVAARLEASTPAPLGVSVGIAVSAPGESREALLRRADEALYVDKEAGRRGERVQVGR